MCELVVILDGGRHGNASGLVKPWIGATIEKEEATELEEGDADADADKAKSPGISRKSIYVVMSEDSVRARRYLVRGTASLDQVEVMHMLSSAAISLPERAGKHFPGTNKGTVLGPVLLPESTSGLQATVKAKRNIYGKRNRIAVGGKSTEGKLEKRNDTDVEPLFWWTMPAEFYEELIHRYFIKNVIDLTPGDGRFAEVCIKHRAGYLVRLTCVASFVLKVRLTCE